ncbi:MULTISPECIES: LysR family transcriptional regulator [Pseudomonadati]|uniref:LysR family transcriptional regulator n=1 Tax=Shewanella aestuarii TaxID=1028752 RepID=A0ABT0KWY8_9GAMM|nr:LysR family transcriptional regulator [Shewanella aestuarii]MCL1115976.1 LysR family transcriptional regulator [Shewanella aestuarii]GGN69787.1 LysR family transcriptional regulator [Shewanella aestuarii]
MLVKDLQVTLKVAEFKSIKLAAESLDMQIATASAALKRVEKSFGIELFVRSTRNLRLTSAGEKFIPQIEQAYLMLTNISESVREEQGLVEGDLRLSAPSDLGRSVLLPWVNEFMASHPKINLKLHISDSNIDFFRDPIDIGVRYGVPKDSSMYGYKICDVPIVLCAAPSYLEQFGTPVSPNDLATHKGLCFQLNGNVHDTWSFTNGEETIKVKLNSDRTTNDSELVKRWCADGYGLAQKSILEMADELLAGNVQMLLPSYSKMTIELWLICPSRQLITPMMRLFREHIRKRCQDKLSELASAGYVF